MSTITLPFDGDIVSCSRCGCQETVEILEQPGLTRTDGPILNRVDNAGGTRSPSALANKIAERSNLSPEGFRGFGFGIQLGDLDPPAAERLNHPQLTIQARQHTVQV